VAFGWVVVLGVLAAVALVVADRRDDHTIKYWTETVSGKEEVCNPTNEYLPTRGAPGQFVILGKNSGNNICFYKANGAQLHQPYVNRLSQEKDDPELFKPVGSTWVLTLARIYPETTPSVVRAERR
jgi:hypothetical protein